MNSLCRPWHTRWRGDDIAGSRFFLLPQAADRALTGLFSDGMGDVQKSIPDVPKNRCQQNEETERPYPTHERHDLFHVPDDMAAKDDTDRCDT